MTVLLVDAGNSRIKLALLESDQLRASSAVALDALSPELFQRGHFREMLIANVAGEAAAHQLAALAEQWGCSIRIVTSEAQAYGVINAYRVPEKLGADRWVAMIGARHLYPGALCVISIGTAMTLDALDARGQHLGGLIVPGPHLMVESLFTNTSDIRRRAVGGERNRELFAVDTLGAVTQGAEHGLAALIDRFYVGTRKHLNAPVRLIISGGACAEIEHLIEHPFVAVPDLVLRGLAIIALNGHGASPGTE